ncbi:hypothetical protein [Vibrio sp.]|nr:hypothetical protein [Vibrio sp.]
MFTLSFGEENQLNIAIFFAKLSFVFAVVHILRQKQTSTTFGD